MDYDKGVFRMFKPNKKETINYRLYLRLVTYINITAYIQLRQWNNYWKINTSNIASEYINATNYDNVNCTYDEGLCKCLQYWSIFHHNGFD